MARAISGPWAMQSARAVGVENVAGAGSLIGTGQLARAPKDGLTLGVITSNHTIIPWVFKNVTFDATADFTPIAMPHIAAGKLKGLALNTPVRTEIAPQIPTLVETGFPKYNVDA